MVVDLPRRRLLDTIDEGRLVGHLRQGGEPALADRIDEGPRLDPGRTRRPQPQPRGLGQSPVVLRGIGPIASRDRAVDLDPAGHAGKIVVADVSSIAWPFTSAFTIACRTASRIGSRDSSSASSLTRAVVPSQSWISCDSPTSRSTTRTLESASERADRLRQIPRATTRSSPRATAIRFMTRPSIAGLSSRSSNISEQIQQDHGSHRCGDQRPQQAIGTHPQQPEDESADQGADDSDDQILDPSRTATLDQLPRQPSGGQADQEKQE